MMGRRGVGHPSITAFNAFIQQNPPADYSESRLIDAAEVRKHSTPNDAWISHKGKVYNVTPYLRYHPGGLGCFGDFLGYDITKVGIHPHINMAQVLAPVQIGVMQGEAMQRPQNQMQVLRGQL